MTVKRVRVLGRLAEPTPPSASAKPDETVLRNQFLPLLEGCSLICVNRMVFLE
jgi:hypothetical protein